MSLMDHAKTELDRINFGEEDTTAMLDILGRFFDQWDSGGAVSCVAPVLQRLIAGQPLAPLTGEDDEWMEVHGGIRQNIRCGSVFKDEDGRVYDIDVPGRPTITFPYDPISRNPHEPVMTVRSTGK